MSQSKAEKKNKPRYPVQSVFVSSLSLLISATMMSISRGGLRTGQEGDSGSLDLTCFPYMLRCDVWNEVSSQWVPGMLLLLQLLSGIGYPIVFGKSFQMTDSKAVQATEVLLHVALGKGAMVLLIDFVMNAEQGMLACPLIQARGVSHETVVAGTTAGFHLTTAKRDESSTAPVNESLEGSGALFRPLQTPAKPLGLSGGQEVSLQVTAKPGKAPDGNLFKLVPGF